MKDASSGEAEAQNSLGDMYFEGYETEQDYKEAFKWYLRAAEQGHGMAQYYVALAQYVLAKMFIDGQYIEQDLTKGLDLLQKASDQGLALAQYDLGTIYCEGKIVESDIDNGVEYLKLAADQGNKDGQFNLGLAYTNLSEPDYDMAEKYLLEASYNGHFKAIFELSRLYTLYKKDYRQGLLWVIVALEYCETVDEQRYKRIKSGLESKLSTADRESISAEARDIIATLDASLY
ncbi:MAG: tetratricopeptide repeat protein [Candidatus Cloacimonadaceae bacterium]|nr:tetratricopeptide repeat protein [Candidatus Cloacimonadaceae bacterium]MDP3114059.1 tetratricopeptide repeat protein [Candidatus Cloacimonadaceae bacterium]